MRNIREGLVSARVHHLYDTIFDRWLLQDADLGKKRLVRLKAAQLHQRGQILTKFIGSHLSHFKNSHVKKMKLLVLVIQSTPDLILR